MKEEDPLLFALKLNEDGSSDTDKAYIRLPLTDCRMILRFILSSESQVDRFTILQTNYPVKKAGFQRDTFQPLEFQRHPNQFDVYCDLELDTPGTYAYRIERPGHDNKKVVSNVGRFVVEPRLWTHRQGVRTQLPLDALMIVSAIPKWMGPLSSWEPLVATMAYAGYNMVHFVPMQQRGSSNSPYSIADQLNFADDLFDQQDHPASSKDRTRAVATVLRNMEEQHNILSLSDVVWNHTSNDSAFLLDHPDAGYNLHNSPHLRPAYELDSALLDLSKTCADHGLKTTLTSAVEVDQIMNHIRTNVFPFLKLWEYKVIDVEANVTAFRNVLCNHIHNSQSSVNNVNEYTNIDWKNLPLKKIAERVAKDAIRLERLGARFPFDIDLERATSIVSAWIGTNVTQDTMDQHVDAFTRLLNEFNLSRYQSYDQDVDVALSNTRNRVIYRFISPDGLRLGTVTAQTPLVETYFTRLEDPTAKHPPGSKYLANNGWIWNADPMLDFAGPDSSAYLRREVIVWEDCVKLRYGEKPADNTWLWDHMQRYTEMIASMFHGIRIDNCHSTPIHVAEYLLDAARRVRPDLYVVAELFTGSEALDNIFVSRLGIHSLIREAMQAWDPHELSRLVHRHGGKPVGSMDEDMLWKRTRYEGYASKNGKMYENVYTIPVLRSSMPRALFMDCTHDNESPSQKRTPQDALPNAALVAFSDCAIGSVKGYDELYPRLLDLVNETRHYAPPDPHAGILPVKHRLQQLHADMSFGGYIEVHVHQENDYLLVHRQHPGSQAGYLLIARTSFPNQPTGIAPIYLRKTMVDFIFGYSLVVDGSSPADNGSHDTLRGLPSHLVTLPSPRFVNKSDDKGDFVEVVLPNEFPPGSIIVLRTSIGDRYEEAYRQVTTMEDSVVADLDLVDINIALYRCDNEERDMTGGDGVYQVPNYGSLVYAGLQGFVFILKPIIANNDLGHPLCDNLRQGKWALDYTTNRLTKHLQRYPHLIALHDWLSSRFDTVREMPDFLVPKYFAMTVQTAFDKVYHRGLSLLSPFVQQSNSDFIQQLAMTSVQMLGEVTSTGLHPSRSGPSLAAGLPHFTNGPFRTWGRDVFISLRGLLLVTGRFDAAKEHLLAFAGSLKHGLIPNLLDSVRQPRYNARDAVWFFLQALQDYDRMAPDAMGDILQATVPRRFPKNDEFVSVEDGYQYTCTVEEIMQEIFERHAKGIHFTEYRAGPDIDRQMSEAGFQINIDVDWQKTGFAYGGNAYNCGTWMDKMGESEKAHNKGLPGTPRDGAPIEITGLIKSAIRWVIELHAAGRYRFDSVDAGQAGRIPFTAWNDMLARHFEWGYFIPKDSADDAQHHIVSHLVHRRAIYKDVCKVTPSYDEYQFRPNACVAMVVAPELFDPAHIKEALQNIRDVLLAPLGMRTLDPADHEYRPDYDNANDSDDPKVAKGRNYHQGPEWLWVTGFFLRACHDHGVLAPQDIYHILSRHRNVLENDVWRGLPELTNRNGTPCYDSCHTQSWSSATLLDLMYDMQQANQ